MERKEVRQREMITIDNAAAARQEACDDLLQVIAKLGWRMITDCGSGDNRVVVVERLITAPEQPTS